MTEWKLFPDNEFPVFTQPNFFEGLAWVDPIHQVGHTERTDMVAAFIFDHYRREMKKNLPSIIDLGCGDGSLLAKLQSKFKYHQDLYLAGYDICDASLAVAYEKGLRVGKANILDLKEVMHSLGDYVVLTEVLEHLKDPHGYLTELYKYCPITTRLIVSSPSAEDDQWHYEDHAWAWDMDGYRELLDHNGWHVFDQVECAGPEYSYMNDITRNVKFQAAIAVRAI